MTLTLYDYPRSSSAWRVRIALALKNIDYETVTVDIGRDGPRELRAAHESVNPQGQVPVLEWREGTHLRRITQSIAIIEFLEESYPEPALLPADPYLRARARQLAEMINAGVQPLQNNAVLAHLSELGVDDGAWARWAIDRGLRAVEVVLSETAGTFAIGDRPTVADVFLIPQVANAHRHGVSLREMPCIARIEAACLNLSAFKGTAAGI